ncbi:MAG: hypothetical protein ABJA80_08550 [bacterium]
MLPFILLAQLALPADSNYTSAALRALVARASVENHAPPPGFRGYRARVETELSFILRDTLGRESAAQIEQLASTASWTRGGEYDVHVVGYRSQGSGVPYSALSFVHGWTEPSLYGDRLRLGVQAGDTTSAKDRKMGDTIFVVHPFAEDRDRYYRFSGGDTVGVLRTAQRTITIVQVHATPHLPDSTRLAAFDGDIQLDLARGQIVRMRGQFVVLGTPASRPLLSRVPGIVGVAYTEFVNAEVNGRYWLPASQRTEFQSQVALLGRSRAVMRIVSEFTHYVVDDTSAAAATTGDGNRTARVTTWAPSDSVSHFGDWRTGIGVATTSVSASDFDDIGPDRWRSTGGVLVDFTPTRTSNLIGYDRVGGLFTGIEGTVRLRDLFPGLGVGARVGWAWTERTVRGGANVSLQRGDWSYGLVAERVLASTNDFVRPFGAERGGLGAFISSLDEFDYIDRRRALASATHVFGSFSDAYVTIALGGGRDRSEVARLTHGLRASPSFLPNRGADDGSYALATLDAELHPKVSGDFVDPGIGARLHLEAGHGALDWHRAELSLSARQYVGPFAFSAHADGGIVVGSDIPPQTLFELGGTGTLPGYAYKQFSGDRAALFRGFASYTLPVWATPTRVWRNFYVPGLAPGFATGLSGGWTQISSAASRASVLALGVPTTASGRIRATAGGGMTLFGGNVHLGIARAVDEPASWKFVFGSGIEF